MGRERADSIILPSRARTGASLEGLLQCESITLQARAGNHIARQVGLDDRPRVFTGRPCTADDPHAGSRSPRQSGRA